MKLLLFVLSLFGVTAQAFHVDISTSTSGKRGRRLLPSFIQGTLRPDSSQEVVDALRISKEFGAASQEARVAWDIVEEMDSNWTPVIHAKTSQYSLDEVHQMDYALQVGALARLLRESQETMSHIKALATNLKQMELDDPTLSKLPASRASSSLRTVLSEAKAAAEVNGPNSKEALAAWDAVESCVNAVNGGGVEEECSVESMYRYSAAALKAHHYYDAIIDSELLQEAVNAIDTLNALRRFVHVEDNRLNGGDSRLSP
jgi:hypothetical protein